MRVHSEGIPLGLLEDREYDEVKFQTEPGDLILLCSDGVPDQVDAKDMEYGNHRAFRVMKSLCHSTPKEIVEAILADIDAHRGDVPLTDDQTLIVIRVD